MRGGTHGAQRLQLGLDIGQLARITDRKEITGLPEVALDAMPGDALAHLVAGGAGNRGVHLKVVESLGAQQLASGRVFMGHHEPRVTRRCALRGTLPVDHHDARLRMHFSQ
ncbi:hypothetical protein D9M73_294770 [compost metagenome]